MKGKILSLAAAAAVGLMALASGVPAHAQANKVGVAASTADFMWCSQLTPLQGSSSIECEDMAGNDGATGTVISDAGLPLMTTILGPLKTKFSTTGDAVIDVNLECMLFNEVKSTHDDVTPEVSTSTAGLLVFAVIDDDDELGEGSEVGEAPVAVGVTGSYQNPFDYTAPLPGVRFCSRLVELEFGGGDDTHNTMFVRALIASESTHGFKWIAKNPVQHFSENDLWISIVGVIDSGPVGGKRGTQVSGVGFGKRLMTVESIKLPNSSTF